MQVQFQLVAHLTLLVTFLPLMYSDLNSDAGALLDFASSVSQLRKLNWDSTNSICTSWYGITCTADGTRVGGIHLPGIGLSGSIPPNTIGRLDSLEILSLRSNYLLGNIPPEIFSMPNLQVLYLQNNNFTGEIPSSFSPCLSVINLSFNSLNGEIPSSLTSLKRLSVLDLSFNSLSGVIPSLHIPSLEILNLSFNLLNGSIPSVLQKFQDSSFIGNHHLCGPPLSTYCSASSQSDIAKPESSSAPLKASNSRKVKTGSIIAIAVGISLISTLLLLVAVLFYFRKKNNSVVRAISPSSYSGKGDNLRSSDFGSGVEEADRNKLVVLGGCSFSFDLEDLLRASAEVLGKGTYGTSYRAILDEATTVVVKRLKEVTIEKREFEQHMMTLDKLSQHPNIVPVLAYFCSKDEKLLVYEYMPAKSLYSALHGNKGGERTTIDWNSRLKIALGAAKGIAHIHSHDNSKHTHGNIKSSNILLTLDLAPRVSDFCLTPTRNQITTKRSFPGYVAPELIGTHSNRSSQKSDAYSFGVLLLEMLTAKSATKYSGYGEMIDLPRWVRSVVSEEWTAEVFDVELLKFQGIEEELVQMLQIALSCVTKVAEMRPSMNDVVRMIEDIRCLDLEA